MEEKNSYSHYFYSSVAFKSQIDGIGDEENKILNNKKQTNKQELLQRGNNCCYLQKAFSVI